MGLFTPKDPPGVDRPAKVSRREQRNQAERNGWNSYVEERLAWHREQSERRVYNPRGQRRR